MYAVKETQVGEFINAIIESEHGSALIVKNDLGGLEMCLVCFDSNYMYAKMMHSMDDAFEVISWLCENLVDNRLTFMSGKEIADEWCDRAEAAQFAASIVAYLSDIVIA